MSDNNVAQMEEKSTHKVEVVPIVLEKHPNADTLSVVQVFGYTICVRTADWEGITLAAYLPPDSSVDVKRPEFAFLAPDAKSDGRARIKAKKLRGIISFGCMIPAPADTKEGDNVAEMLGVTHYEPPIKGEGDPKQRMFMGGEVASGPNVYTVKYDVDAFRRYHTLFTPGEQVYVTEKLDGANSRYVFQDGKMHCGSRTEWKKEYPDYSHVTAESLLANGVPEEKVPLILDGLANKPKKQNMWWAILERTPTLRKFCEDNPGTVVYGEVFGNVGRIKYGVPDQFAAFDIMRDGKWLDKPSTLSLLGAVGVPTVPLLAILPYDFEQLCGMAEGNTVVPGADPKAIREGIVITPAEERRDRYVGRVQFKCVSGAYLEKY